MMSPADVRAQLLCKAVDRATRELEEPIDRIKIIGDVARVDCWAGARRVSIAFDRSESGDFIDGTFVPHVGGVSWNAVVVQRQVTKHDRRRWILAGILIALSGAALSYACFRTGLDESTGRYRSYAGVEVCPPKPVEP
jgi:hypothetical protein